MTPEQRRAVRIERCLFRAEEYHTMAETMKSDEPRQMMERLAVTFEDLALRMSREGGGNAIGNQVWTTRINSIFHQRGENRTPQARDHAGAGWNSWRGRFQGGVVLLHHSPSPSATASTTITARDLEVAADQALFGGPF